MKSERVRAITPAHSINAEIVVPPSKSYTNRALIAAALAEGTSKILNPSHSDDSNYLVSALQEFGVTIASGENEIEVVGTNGHFHAPKKELFVGNAGTAMRFLTSFAGLAQGETILLGDEQMQKRPMNDLIEALRMAGIKCTSRNGFPPVTIRGGHLAGGRIDIKGSTSSQFVSSLMLIAPYAKHPVVLHVTDGMSSLPYINMTVHVMRSFGAAVEAVTPTTFSIANADHYVEQPFTVEGDASSATYFLGAAAITGGKATITNLSSESLQGDIRFLQILADMGCTVAKNTESVELKGGKLFGIDVDMNDIPDCVPTLAIVAAFAKGTTTIQHIEHVRYKETDRLEALANELKKIGAGVEVFDDGIAIHPRELHGADIETYNDHRIAMSFAIAGLAVPEMNILNPSCVSKSFPDFWNEFKKLEGNI